MTRVEFFCTVVLYYSTTIVLCAVYDGIKYHSINVIYYGPPPTRNTCEVRSYYYLAIGGNEVRPQYLQ